MPIENAEEIKRALVEGNLDTLRALSDTEDQGQQFSLSLYTLYYLRIACREDDYGTARFIVDNLVRTRDDEFQTIEYLIIYVSSWLNLKGLRWIVEDMGYNLHRFSRFNEAFHSASNHPALARDFFEYLFNHPRFDVNRCCIDYEASSPLWICARMGLCEVLKLLIATRRPIDTNKRVHMPDWPGIEDGHYIPYDIATGETKELIKEYRDNPVAAVTHLRAEFGYSCKDASSIFALIIFHCDGLLELENK